MTFSGKKLILWNNCIIYLRGGGKWKVLGELSTPSASLIVVFIVVRLMQSAFLNGRPRVDDGYFLLKFWNDETAVVCKTWLITAIRHVHRQLQFPGADEYDVHVIIIYFAFTRYNKYPSPEYMILCARRHVRERSPNGRRVTRRQYRIYTNNLSTIPSARRASQK